MTGSILTAVGKAKLASATPENQLEITHVAVGDGNGSYPVLTENMIALAHEVWRGHASNPIRDTQATNTLMFESALPVDVGGFTIREIAIFDSTGAMIAIGHVDPAQQKRLLTQSTGINMTVRIIIALANAAETNLILQTEKIEQQAGNGLEQEPPEEPVTHVSRRKLLTAFSMAGAAFAAGSILPGSVAAYGKEGLSVAGTIYEGSKGKDKIPPGIAAKLELATHNDLAGRDLAGAHPASSIQSANGETQQQVNDYVGAKWYANPNGYPLNARVRLDNGDIVRSTVANNTADPNADMAGWIKTNSASYIVDESGITQQIINASLRLQYFSHLKSFTPWYDGQVVYVAQRKEGYIYGGGLFKADLSDTTSVDNDGTILVGVDGTRWKRQYSTYADPCWFGADYTASVDCSPEVQKAVDISMGRVWFGNADRNFKMTTPIGLPTNGLTGEKLMDICGDGARIWVYSSTGIFTSQRSIGSENSSSDLYTSVLEIGRGLRFQGDGVSDSVVINGDRLYNVIMRGGRYLRISALVKASVPRRSETTGYVQSIQIISNHLALCKRIVDSKRGFNVTFSYNMGESCYGGIYIDGDGSPAVNVIEVQRNLWESSGVLAKLGAVYAGTFMSNYCEGNSAGDLPTLKCLIEIGKVGSTAYSSGITFIGNQFGAAATYKTDVDYCDVKFKSSLSGTNLDTLAPPVFVGNWSNGYRMYSEGQVVTQFGNSYSGSSLSRHKAPRLHTEARVSFALSRKDFLSSTELSSGVHTIAEVDTSIIKSIATQSNRACTADLNVFMQMKNSGGVVLGSAVAKIMLVAQGSEGIGTGASSNIYVDGSLIGFAQNNSGVIDTVNSVSLSPHFTNPSLSITQSGDKYLLKLSGYSATPQPAYGASNRISSNCTMSIYGLNSGASLAGQLSF
ncbi:hypothetical protein FE783_36365 [Paenibacillus mesophilus]|uniref:phage tail-collar fiber domain-containing protein n=1 Tax=Paenibacillus mesophilus TaxID=2582849 RepID=UPI00110D940B|nr:phage tail protein [Paenibacillus mesophilus]TMV43065.1 hypothetical protein FE783_36365 [Paenibacillus mesophilus]